MAKTAQPRDNNLNKQEREKNLIVMEEMIKKMGIAAVLLEVLSSLEQRRCHGGGDVASDE